MYCTLCWDLLTASVHGNWHCKCCLHKSGRETHCCLQTATAPCQITQPVNVLIGPHPAAVTKEQITAIAALPLHETSWWILEAAGLPQQPGEGWAVLSGKRLQSLPDNQAENQMCKPWFQRKSTASAPAVLYKRYKLIYGIIEVSFHKNIQLTHSKPTWIHQKLLHWQKTGWCTLHYAGGQKERRI